MIFIPKSTFINKTILVTIGSALIKRPGDTKIPEGGMNRMAQ